MLTADRVPAGRSSYAARAASPAWSCSDVSTPRTSSQGSRVASLLQHVDLAQVHASDPQPDAFVFSIVVDATQVTAQESDLTPALAEIVDVVLADGEDEPRS